MNVTPSAISFLYFFESLPSAKAALSKAHEGAHGFRRMHFEQFHLADVLAAIHGDLLLLVILISERVSCFCRIL